MKTIIGMAVAAALVACGGAEKKPDTSSQVLHANAPEWVNRGSGAFGGEKGKIFYGLGVASNIPSAARRRVVANARARDELAKTLDAWLAQIDKDYRATTGSGASLADVQQTLRSYSRTELSPAMSVVDHWVDGDGTEFALAQLDVETFKSSVEKTNQLSAQLRDAFRATADRAFDEVAAAEARR
jgi:hypothetical protein